MDVVEPYHPDRVQRQFGLIHKIPQAPIAAEKAKRLDRSYVVKYNYTTTLFEQWESHLLAPHYRGMLLNPDDPDCEPDYMEWYKKVSHPLIQNPVHNQAPEAQGRRPRGQFIVDNQDRQVILLS